MMAVRVLVGLAVVLLFAVGRPGVGVAGGHRLVIEVQSITVSGTRRDIPPAGLSKAIRLLGGRGFSTQ
jgi:hypothetical protein